MKGSLTYEFAEDAGEDMCYLSAKGLASARLDVFFDPAARDW
jgi:hypothetical protein